MQQAMLMHNTKILRCPVALNLCADFWHEQGAEARDLSERGQLSTEEEEELAGQAKAAAE